MARRALLIGVSEYGEGFEALPGSLLDVQGMAEVLGNPEQGAFEVEPLLENPGLSEMTTGIEQFLRGAGREDLLLLYFSGHGDLGNSIAQERLHLCAKETCKQGNRLVESSAMSADFLKRQMDLSKSQRIVVILDCCYSGAIADLLRKGDGAGVVFEELKAEGRVILASSSASESSYQAVDGLSLYTHYLLEGMAGAARSDEAAGEWIVARELHDYAKRKLAVEQQGGLSPEIIVEKTGYDVGVVRAPRLDPVLEYRRVVDALFIELDEELGLGFDGTISDLLDRGSLETLQGRLGLDQAVAQQVEQKVQVPYLVRARQRQRYRQYFEQAVGDGCLPSQRQRRRLEQIRQNLRFGKADAIQIEQLVGQERQLKPRPVVAPSQMFESVNVERTEVIPPLSQESPLRSQPQKPEFKQTGPVCQSVEFQVVTLKVKIVPRLLGFGQKPKISQQRQPGKAVYFVESLGNGVELEMVRIPAGKFMMGSLESEEGRSDDEGPQHEVTVPEFTLGQFAVTQAQYQAVMGENPAEFKGEERPVEQVSWNDAQAFCQKLSEKLGREYRLPSEAEWEYACRAGTTTPLHFGETITPDFVNYRGGSTYGQGPKGQYREQTTEVGSFPSNGFGLYDMHGNVREWCADRWHDNYKDAPTDGTAWLTNSGSKQLYVLRGGSWVSPPWNCRSASRTWHSPSNRYSSFGFRVACVALRAV